VPAVADSSDLHRVQRREWGDFPGQELVLPHFLQTYPPDHLRFAKKCKQASSLENNKANSDSDKFSEKNMSIPHSD
jgi:hypothetical protein